MDRYEVMTGKMMPLTDGSLADALATLAVQRWLEQWLVAE